MSGENDQMCWRAWHQTIPSSHRVQDSVTRSDEAPLPSSVRESLNSLADFYSKVYSEQPVPAWSTDAAAPPPRPADVDMRSRVEQLMSNAHEVAALPSDLDVAFTVDEVQAAAVFARGDFESGLRHLVIYSERACGRPLGLVR